jgi:hypothetical protein
MIEALAVALLISCACNAFFVYRRKQALSQPKYTHDAAMILNDLTRGGSVIRISRIDPQDIYLRSPRDVG